MLATNYICGQITNQREREREREIHLVYTLINAELGIPSSWFAKLARFWAQATDILADLASNASSITLGFNQSSAAGH